MKSTARLLRLQKTAACARLLLLLVVVVVAVVVNSLSPVTAHNNVGGGSRAAHGRQSKRFTRITRERLEAT